MSRHVAKIGRKYHAADPLYGTPWRDYMRPLAKWLLICVVLMLVAAGATLLSLLR